MPCYPPTCTEFQNLATNATTNATILYRFVYAPEWDKESPLRLERCCTYSFWVTMAGCLTFVHLSICPLATCCSKELPQLLYTRPGTRYMISSAICRHKQSGLSALESGKPQNVRSTQKKRSQEHANATVTSPLERSHSRTTPAARTRMPKP